MHVMQFGAHLKDIDLFDAGVFSLSSTESIAMDPQIRLLLQLCVESLFLSHSMLDLSKAGVYLGMTWTDYVHLSSKFGFPVTVYTAQAAVLGVAAGRLSYHFGFKGPSLTVETACSSALVATNTARDSLLRNSGCAICGGINSLINSTTTYNTLRAGMLTQDSRCKALDIAADGYVRSEGCAIVVISTEESQWNDHLCLLSAAVNQDGRSSALTAPNGPAQQNVINLALSCGSLSPSDINGLSMHGTGTSLGDPIEVGAACTVFSQQQGLKHGLNIQASKSSVGHAEPASGIMSWMYLNHVSYIST
jgi:acyl transferase domain-containing protein